VDFADEVTVKTVDDKEYKATIVGRDPSCVAGTWQINGNVNIADLTFVGCNVAITGTLTGASTSNLRIHACAKITASSTVSLMGRLSVDVYNVSITTGTRVTVVQGSSVTGTFGSVLVTGFSVNDASIPFRPGYTGTTAHVDFGTIAIVPAGSTNGGGIVPVNVAPGSQPAVLSPPVVLVSNVAPGSISSASTTISTPATTVTSGAPVVTSTSGTVAPSTLTSSVINPSAIISTTTSTPTSTSIGTVPANATALAASLALVVASILAALF